MVNIDGTYYGAFDGTVAPRRAARPARPDGHARDRARRRDVLHGHDDPRARPARSTTRTAPSASATTGGTTTSTSLHYSFVEAVRIGAQRTVDALGLIVNGLGQLASSIVNHPTEAPPVAGPVGIATQIGDVFWQLGPMVTLYVAGILSANLAVVNILPFPPLDGGRMLIITLKRLFGARISMRAEQMTYVVGFVFLFAFLIWITGFDIVRGSRRLIRSHGEHPRRPPAAPSSHGQRRRGWRPRRLGRTRSSSSR